MSEQGVAREAPPGAEAGGARSVLSNLLSPATFGPLLALIVASTFFAFQSEQFLTGRNFSLIFQQVMVVGTLAVGQTMIILVAGIDLSCGAIMAFGSVFMAKMAVDVGINPILAVGLGLGVCTLFGLTNGLLVTRLNLPPFIVTLGMLNIGFALTSIYSENQTITGLPPFLTFFGETFLIGETAISYGTLLTLGLFLLVWFILRQTAAGYHLYATGNNIEAARLTGINVKRLLLVVYGSAGLIYGIAAWLLIARTGVGDPQAGQTDNLDSITAVVLGGTSLFGGRGSVLGTLMGALIVGVFRNGLQLMGVASVYQVLITGILVILAVSVDQIARRRTA